MHLPENALALHVDIRNEAKDNRLLLGTEKTAKKMRSGLKRLLRKFIRFLSSPNQNYIILMKMLAMCLKKWRQRNFLFNNLTV